MKPWLRASFDTASLLSPRDGVFSDITELKYFTCNISGRTHIRVSTTARWGESFNLYRYYAFLSAKIKQKFI